MTRQRTVSRSQEEIDAMRRRLWTYVEPYKKIELERATGIPYATIDRIIKKGHIPKDESLLKLTQFLDISVDWLLTGEGTPRPVEGQIKIPFVTPSGEDREEFVCLPDGKFKAMGLKLNKLKAFSAFDQSMSPALQAGTLTLIDTAAAISEGIFAIAVDGASLIRRCKFENGKIKLVPENPEYSSLELDPKEEHEFKVLGRVVWAERWL